MASSYTFAGKHGVVHVDRRHDADGAFWLLRVGTRELRYREHEDRAAQLHAMRLAFAEPEARCDLCLTYHPEDALVGVDNFPLGRVCGACRAELLEDDEDPCAGERW